MRSNVKAYQKVNREGGLLAADPHTVILMLFDGILESIAIARGAIERRDLTVKSEKLSKAINIIRSLQNSLDKDAEPQISENFNALYDCCIDRLVDASLTLNVAKLDEVVELLRPIRDVWRDMPETEKQKGMVKLNDRKQAQDQAMQSTGI